MGDWYYDKEAFRKTPSRQDGINCATENKYRKEGARFIIDLGSVLELGYNTWATGVVYFHRFYMIQSLKKFPHYVTACCCLFLAGKVEETPKKCKDIIRVAQNLLSEENFKTFGVDPKEEVMTLEKILLQTIKFDFKVHHPYSFLTKYAKILKGDKNKLQKMVQMAWTFINDSLCTTLSIQWEPEIIAIALMHLASKLSKFQVITWKGRQPNQVTWWEMFVKDLQMNIIEDICHQVLDLYSDEKKSTEEDTSAPEVSSKHLKCKKSDKPELNSASNQIPIVPLQYPLVSLTQFAQIPVQETSVTPHTALVLPQNPVVSSIPFVMTPTVKNETVNADPRTIKSDLNISKTEPFSVTTVKIKTEPIFIEEEPSAIDTQIEPFHKKREPTFIKTEPLWIKTESPSADTTLLTNEIPFYNPTVTLPASSGTPVSTASTIVSAANLQSSSPSFSLPDFSRPPPDFNLTESANHWTPSNLNPWKVNARMNNEINETDRFRKNDLYQDICNNNYQKFKYRGFMRDDFDNVRYRNPNNAFQRYSYRNNENWDSKSYNRNRSTNNGFQDRRFSDNLKNYSNQRVYPYSKNFKLKSNWDDDGSTHNFKQNFLKNNQSSRN